MARLGRAGTRRSRAAPITARSGLLAKKILATKDGRSYAGRRARRTIERTMAERTSGLHRIVTIPILYETIQRSLGGNRGRSRVASILFERLQGRTVVEIGCGPGSWVPHLGHVESYLGIDRNAEHVAAAKERYEDTRVRFERADLEDDAAFDLLQGADTIIGIGILHHLDDAVAGRLLEQACARLPESGLYVGIEPAIHRSQHPIARILKALDSGRNIRTVDGYTALLAPWFGDVHADLRTDLMRVPYSHCLLQAVGLRSARQRGAETRP